MFKAVQKFYRTIIIGIVLICAVFTYAVVIFTSFPNYFNFYLGEDFVQGFHYKEIGSISYEIPFTSRNKVFLCRMDNTYRRCLDPKQRETLSIRPTAALNEYDIKVLEKLKQVGVLKNET